MTIAVLSAGALTTFQDLGRAGGGASGVAISGAFDVFAARAANLLVGNLESAPVLEMTLAGPTLRFDQPGAVALTGSRFAAVLNERTAPWSESFNVRAGDTLKIGRTQTGARGYLAIGGLIAEERMLGSASRHVAAQLGPPPLESGDTLVGVEKPFVRARLRDGALHVHRNDVTVRAVRGPQWDAFTSHTHNAIFVAPFSVTPDSNRTGIRLEGPPLDHAGSGEIDPEGAVAGSVQVPPNGRPIVLGPDGPVTGGYPKIAVVIAADVCVLAHCKPGDIVRFAEVTTEEARTAWLEREQALRGSIDRSER